MAEEKRGTEQRTVAGESSQMCELIRKEVMKVMKEKEASEPVKVNFAQFEDFAGMNVTSTSNN